MIRLVLLALLVTLSGCTAPMAMAVGGVLMGVAAVTNADVNAAQAYVDWRNGKPKPQP